MVLSLRALLNSSNYSKASFFLHICSSFEEVLEHEFLGFEIEVIGDEGPHILVLLNAIVHQVDENEIVMGR